MDDARAKLLAQALYRLHGEDDVGLKAELVRQKRDKLPEEEVLSFLPETAESLSSLCSMGHEDLAQYWDSWQQAQFARLKQFQFQLTSDQANVVEEVLSRLLPKARESRRDSPNARGTALYLLCLEYMERGGTV